MSSYTEETANELADKALAEAEIVGDTKIVDKIDELLGASSQSLQEAYSTAVRVRRAEARARELLADSARKRGLSHEEAAKLSAKSISKPKPMPVAKVDVAPEIEIAPEPAPAETPAEPPGPDIKPTRKGW